MLCFLLFATRRAKSEADVLCLQKKNEARRKSCDEKHNAASVARATSDEKRFRTHCFANGSKVDDENEIRYLITRSGAALT